MRPGAVVVYYASLTKEGLMVFVISGYKWGAGWDHANKHSKIFDKAEGSTCINFQRQQ